MSKKAGWYPDPWPAPPGRPLLPIDGLLDLLWPLRDGKKQALLDKVARTNVVRSR